MPAPKKERPPPPAPMTPDELRTIRESLGWSLADMACALGMDGQRAQVNKWEMGHVPIRPVVALAVRHIEYLQMFRFGAGTLQEIADAIDKPFEAPNFSLAAECIKEQRWPKGFMPTKESD